MDSCVHKCGLPSASPGQAPSCMASLIMSAGASVSNYYYYYYYYCYYYYYEALTD